MKKHHFITALLLLTLPFVGFAQPINLIGNGDFETFTTPPTGSGQMSNATGWYNLNGNTAWPYATPDYFNALGTGGTAWPNTYAGDILPQSGSSLTGFITNNFFSPDFREYISYGLSMDMEVGETYTISFWLSNGTGNWYGSRGSNNIGVAFTMDQPVQTQREVLASVVPQLEITTVIHHTVWQQYSFSYTATAPFKFVTIGNFRNDANTTYATYTTGNALAYYFIDNVVVQNENILNAQTIELRQIENDDKMELAWEMPSDAEGSAFLLERSADDASFLSLDFSEVKGGSSATQRFVDPNALPGQVYFYRLRETSANGEISYSPVIQAKFGKAGGYAAGNIFPNPVTEHFSIEFAAVDEGNLELDLIDMNGRIVMNDVQEIEGGQTRMTYEIPKNLSAGIYHARFSFGAERFNRQVLVVAAN